MSEERIDELIVAALGGHITEVETWWPWKLVGFHVKPYGSKYVYDACCVA